MASEFTVAESNSAAASVVSGTLDPGGGGEVVGIAFAGQSSGHVGTVLEGIYGSIVVNADGSFSYSLDNHDADTQQLAAGQTAHEQFSVTWRDGGHLTTSTLAIDITGLDEPGQHVVTASSSIHVSPTVVTDVLDRIESTATMGIIVDGGTESDRPVFNGSLVVGSATAEEANGIEAGASGGLVNNGRIDLTVGAEGQGATGIFGGGAEAIVNNGVIHATNTKASDWARAVGIYSYYHGETIVNAGLIEIESASNAYGIWNKGLSSHVTNSGVIRVVGGLNGDPLGVVGIRGGQSSGAMIVNSGTIEVTATDPDQPAIGIRLFPDSSNIHSFGTVINTGTIVAETAILAIEGYVVSLSITNSGHIEGDLLLDDGDNLVTNAAGGSWIGTLTLGGAHDSIVNAGNITGDVLLGGGNDMFDGSGGSVSGSIAGGGGFDYLKGGSGADRLDGGDGNDALCGNGGADTLRGGAGADRFVYADAGDSTAAHRDSIVDFESGRDILDLSALAPTSVSITASGDGHIVTAQTAGGTVSIAVGGTITSADIVTTAPGSTVTGTSGADLLFAGDGGATLRGRDGDDSLFGSTDADLLDGGAGGDTMRGGAGDDIYIVDADGDRPIEMEGGGTDEVRTSADFSLQQWVENITLTGSASIGAAGNELANILTGNAGDNFLTAGGGDDLLIGGGGADTMRGGAGADIFRYDSADESTAASMDYLEFFEHGIDRIDLTTITPVRFVFDEFDNPWSSSHWTTVTIETDTGDTMAIRISGHATTDDFILPDGHDFGGDDFRLLAWEGAAVSTGGTGTVFGTDALQDVTVLDLPGTLLFDPSFNHGGDRIRLSGDAADYTVVRVGSLAEFSDGDTVIDIPTGFLPLDIVFDDGTRSLAYDDATRSIMFGDQAVGSDAATVIAAPQEPTSIAPVDPEAQAWMIVSPGAEVVFGGRAMIYGTAHAETVSVLAGSHVTFDPSFNGGGDTIVLDGAAAAFAAERSGSTVHLVSGDTEIWLPVGLDETTIRFEDGDRALYFDDARGAVMLGDAVVGTDPAPLDGATLALTA